jgi:glycosyltransferase involved in cell wall biosynthesis
MNARTLISIGLPTYNRSTSLKLAIESVLAQDYSNFELIISDNTSTDGTQSLCEELGRRDQRIRYIRQTTNRGPAANFQAVLDEARGEFFMWLADDDWLDDAYISKCLSELLNNPDYTVVCGQGRYFEKGKHTFDGELINLLGESANERVLSYNQQACFNGMFYGLMRRELLAEMECLDVLGGDWLIVARMAFLGKARTLQDVFINRSAGGASHRMEMLARSVGLSGFMARNAHLYLAYIMLKDVAWQSPIYKPLNRLSRIALGARAAREICYRFWLPLWRDKWRARLNRSHPAESQIGSNHGGSFSGR